MLMSKHSLLLIAGAAILSTLATGCGQVNHEVPISETTVSVSQKTVQVGMKIDVIAKLMATNGFDETMRQMESRDPANLLRMWTVGEGVLIVDYRKDDSISTDLCFLLTTGGPKSTRQNFSLKVKQFTPENGELTTIVPRQNKDAG